MEAAFKCVLLRNMHKQVGCVVTAKQLHLPLHTYLCILTSAYLPLHTYRCILGPVRHLLPFALALELDSSQRLHMMSTVFAHFAQFSLAQFARSLQRDPAEMLIKDAGSAIPPFHLGGEPIGAAPFRTAMEHDPQ
ncbi:hypothetical protein HaLaN_19878, partial [Haematococcus lacustris]